MRCVTAPLSLGAVNDCKFYTPHPTPLPQGAREYGEKFATARMCALKGLEQSEGLQVKSVFFFFGSLFLFASQQKEKVNKGSITYIMLTFIHNTLILCN